MVTLSQDMAQPEAHHRADTGALPSALGRDMSINEVSDTHLFDDAKHEGNTVDLFRVEEDRRGRELPRFSRWWDNKAHGTCGNLLIALTKYTLIFALGCRLTILPQRA
jgi:hypothetical protein